MYGQVCMTLLHMHKGFSHLNEEVNDYDIIIMTSLLYCLCKSIGILNGSHMSPRAQFQFGFWQVRSLTLCLSYLSASCRVGIYNILGSFHYLFISAVCVLCSVGCLDFTCLSCLCASQVAHHPVFIKPGIGEARTTAFQSGIALLG